MHPHIQTRKAVITAITEFDRRGREAFLEHYGFGKAKEYFVWYKGKFYDSKAIAGVAHGHDSNDGNPLAASDFSGGEKTVQRILEKLDFTVVRLPPRRKLSESPIVLTQNEVTAGGEYDFWDDDTGVRYQFPNSYRNRVVTGRPFVYYRGVRRADNKRGPQEYFGSGTIGRVWQDPSTENASRKVDRRWFCAIEDYVSFPAPVPAKVDGKTFEQISGNMGWRTGVREISWDGFKAILAQAGVSGTEPSTETPEISEVQPVEVDDLGEMVVVKTSGGTGAGGAEGARHSGISKIIGDRGEEIVYRQLRRNLPDKVADTVVWVAQSGERPGWDIEYTDKDGARIAVEVKATTLSRFASIELTSNEWSAAEREGESYRIALVANALGKKPRIAWLDDPIRRARNGDCSVEAIKFRMTF